MRIHTTHTLAFFLSGLISSILLTGCPETNLNTALNCNEYGGNPCDDGDPCSLDQCNDGTCLHQFITCEPGLDCVDGVICVNLCENVNCDDDFACTEDSCVRGQCINEPIICLSETEPELCRDGVCVPACESGLVRCAPGFTCHLGACIVNPCFNIVCEMGFACKGGRCLCIEEAGTCDK